MKPGRIPCCVPFCRRTGSVEKHPHATEIICGKCWQRGVPKPLRAVYRRAWRAYDLAWAREDVARAAMARAAIPRSEAVTGEYDAAWRGLHRVSARCVRIWAIVKRKATESAMGL